MGCVKRVSGFTAPTILLARCVMYNPRLHLEFIELITDRPNQAPLPVGRGPTTMAGLSRLCSQQALLTKQHLSEEVLR